MSKIDFTRWTQATANLSWGAQAAMHDALTLAAEGKIELVYGSDYVDGKPCLVNSVGQMLSVGGGQGIPSAHFSEVVGQFDTINRRFRDLGVNQQFHVSETAAAALLHNFGPLKGQPGDPVKPHRPTEEIIAERSDEEFTTSWLQAIATDNAPVEETENEQSDLHMQ